MPHQPMAATSGIAPGGFRGRQTTKRLIEKALHEQQEALHNAGTLLQDLADTPTVLAVAIELEARINTFLAQDETSKVLIGIINRWRDVLEVAPRMAQEKVNKLLGLQLTKVKDETPAAP